MISSGSPTGIVTVFLFFFIHFLCVEFVYTNAKVKASFSIYWNAVTAIDHTLRVVNSVDVLSTTPTNKRGTH